MINQTQQRMFRIACWAIALTLITIGVKSSIKGTNELCKGDQKCVQLVQTCHQKHKLCAFFIPKK